MALVTAILGAIFGALVGGLLSSIESDRRLDQNKKGCLALVVEEIRQNRSLVNVILENKELWEKMHYRLPTVDNWVESRQTLATCLDEEELRGVATYYWDLDKYEVTMILFRDALEKHKNLTSSDAIEDILESNYLEDSQVKDLDKLAEETIDFVNELIETPWSSSTTIKKLCLSIIPWRLKVNR